MSGRRACLEQSSPARWRAYAAAAAGDKNHRSQDRKTQKQKLLLLVMLVLLVLFVFVAQADAAASCAAAGGRGTAADGTAVNCASLLGCRCYSYVRNFFSFFVFLPRCLTCIPTSLLTFGSTGVVRSLQRLLSTLNSSNLRLTLIE